MSTLCNAVLATTAAACGLCAQMTDTRVVRFPLVDTLVVAPGVTAEPLTPGEKAKLAFRNTFGPRAVANRLLSVGIDQLQGEPEEWGGGMDSFVQRFGSRMGQLAVRNSIRLGTDIAFRIDPRYDRCACSGFRARAGHAWKRVLVSRSDTGTEIPAYSNFAGGYITPMVTHAWYPDRQNTWSQKMQSGTFYLGWRGVGNMIREFWPDVKKGIRRGGQDN